ERGEGRGERGDGRGETGKGEREGERETGNGKRETGEGFPSGVPLPFPLSPFPFPLSPFPFSRLPFSVSPLPSSIHSASPASVSAVSGLTPGFAGRALGSPPPRSRDPEEAPGCRLTRRQSRRQFAGAPQSVGWFRRHTPRRCSIAPTM